MKKVLLMLVTVFTITAQAQEFKQQSLVNVNGEGKIKVVPDQASITVSVESKGSKAADVKKENDTKIDAVLKYVKKMGIAAQDFQTQRVYLNDEYDYQKKKHNYVATQTIRILMKDLAKYDEMMEGLVETGINNISNVEFKTSRLEELKAGARRLAVQNARTKANDLVSALEQKIGTAFSITDNTAVEYPQPRYEMKMMNMAADAYGGNQTLAVGEIEITANVAVSFYLFP